MSQHTFSVKRFVLVGVIALLAGLVLSSAVLADSEPVDWAATVVLNGAPDLATVEGIVFQDWDQDGEWAEWEPGLSEAVLVLFDGRGREIARLTTARSGRFAFTGLEVGRYTLVEMDPLGYSTLGSNKTSFTVREGQQVSADFADVLLLKGWFLSGLSLQIKELLSF